MQRKISLLLFFFSLSFYGQNDTISVVKTSNITVVSADKMNVVYRGIPNPISIAVPDCKSFTATGIGLYKKSNGKYLLNPGVGLESIITLDIVLNDGSTIKEEHKFRIKALPKLSGAINGLTCNQSVVLMCKEELKNAIISIDFTKDFLYDLKFNLKQFRVNFDDNRYFTIKGNKFTDEAFDEIKKLKIGSIFTINVSLDSDADVFVNPIKIMIIEDKNYIEYEQDK
jgi:hypothetical protein